MKSGYYYNDWSDNITLVYKDKTYDYYSSGKFINTHLSTSKENRKFYKNYWIFIGEL